MKKACVLLLCIVLILSACGISDDEVENVDEGVYMDEEALLEKVNNDYQQIMTIGTKLINELSGMQPNNEYESLTIADAYAQDMKKYYASLIDTCEKNDNLSGMIFQLQVLEHSCPDPISKRSITSINNQKVLYQLYLKQISSSFSYLSEYMDYLSGNREKPDGEKYFEEVPDMPTPDTVMYEIIYDSEKSDSGVKQYMYLIGDTDEDANMNYNAYIKALGVCKDLEVVINGSTVYVYRKGIMVSAMMAGTDPQKGLFMIVSFKEQ